MANSSRTTVDHDEIRKWVEGHGGHPSRVAGTDNKGGLLRIDFPGYSGEGKLEEISWDEFFQDFEESDLAFLYQDEKAAGHESRFNKLIHRSEHKNDGKSDTKHDSKAKAKK